MTVAERRQREKDQRRESIINAAGRLFFKRGYEKVKVDEIASEAELSKATLYSYFKDKDSIFFAVVNRGTKIFDSIIKEEMERANADGFNGRAISIASSRFVLEYPDYARAYVYFRSGKFEFSDDTDTNADAKEVIKFSEVFLEMVHLAIKNGIDDRIYRSDVNPVTVTVLNIMIREAILTMSPDLKKMLKAYGITMQQFHMEVIDLVHYMVRNNKDLKKEP